MIRAGADASAFFYGNGGGSMSEVPGLMEGVEAVKVMFEGTEIFLKLGGSVANWTVDKIARITALIVHHMQKKKADMKEGEVNFKDLVTKNKSGVGMLQIEEEHMDLFLEYAKETGLSYSIMPDINKQDIYKEIAYPEYQGEAFRYFIARHPDIAKSYTYGEYFDNAKIEDIEEEIKGLGKEAVEYAKELEKKEKQEIKTGNKELSMPIDSSLLHVNEEGGIKQILVAVPNTEDEYIVVSKNQITETDGVLRLHLDADAKYEIVNSRGIAGTEFPRQIKEEEKAVPESEKDSINTISGAQFKDRVDRMEEMTELNRARVAEAKSSVRFKARTESGEVQTKTIIKNQDQPRGLAQPIKEKAKQLERGIEDIISKSGR